MPNEKESISQAEGQSEIKLSRAALRKLLDGTLLKHADIDAFCLDEYPEVLRRFGAGIDRVEKLNLLLSIVDDDGEIAKKIYASQPNQVRRVIQRLKLELPLPAADPSPESSPELPSTEKPTAGSALTPLRIVLLCGTLFGVIGLAILVGALIRRDPATTLVKVSHVDRNRDGKAPPEANLPAPMEKLPEGKQDAGTTGKPDPVTRTPLPLPSRPAHPRPPVDLKPTHTTSTSPTPPQPPPVAQQAPAAVELTVYFTVDAGVGDIVRLVREKDAAVLKEVPATVSRRSYGADDLVGLPRLRFSALLSEGDYAIECQRGSQKTREPLNVSRKMTTTDVRFRCK